VRAADVPCNASDIEKTAVLAQRVRRIHAVTV
jgi:hypothetical protein